jgi:hypothetical protein
MIAELDIPQFCGTLAPEKPDTPIMPHRFKNSMRAMPESRVLPSELREPEGLPGRSYDLQLP